MPKPVKYVGKRGAVAWRVRFRLDGRQLQESFDTKREADAFVSDLTTRDARYALRVLHETEAADTVTLDALADRFFAWKETRVRSDRTVHDYRRDYDKWIKPALGGRRAGLIEESQVQEWIDSLHGQLEAKTILDRHALLYAIYAYGLHPTRRLVDHNPCVDNDLPKKKKKPPKGLHPAEWLALYPALQLIDQDGADFAEFLLASGWRISEASAVGPWDFDDYGNRMFVTMGRVLRRNAAGQHVVVEEGKGDASMRRVELDAGAAAMVRRRLERVVDGGLVFTTKTGAQWHGGNFRNRIWNPAVKAANLSRRPTPHWLRHTAVFWLARSGATLPELQARIGHAHISTTIDVYGSMLQDVSPAALEGFAAMRQPKPPAQLEG